MDWLLAPIDPSRAHDVGFAVSWHARLMVIAWAVLFPSGILAARFFKIWPMQNWPTELDNTGWWRTHLTTQYVGAVAILLAVALILTMESGSVAGTWHQVLGWTAVGLCGLQVLSGWLRGSKGGPTAPAPDGSPRGDHFDMTLRRRVFEYLHKSMGYLALLIACSAIFTGLWISNAPNWMWLLLVAWYVLLAVTAIALQRSGRCVDTYQAIWGKDPSLPGNRRRPIGLGIRRP